MKRGMDAADGSFDQVRAGSDTAEMRQSGDQSDGTVAAHAEIAHVVEEDNTGGGCRLLRSAEESADEHVGTAGLGKDSGAEAVMLGAKNLQARRKAAFSQRRAARDDNARGLSGGVRIDNSDAARHCEDCSVSPRWKTL
jgi:hypothetical protein